MWKIRIDRGHKDRARSARLMISVVSLFFAPLLGSIAFPRVCPAAPPRAGVAVGPRFGQLAPDFALPNIKGRPVALGELRGQDILLVFVNIHCPHCAAKIPLLNEVEEGGLKVVSVALGATAAQVAEYIEDRDVKFDILPDTRRIVGRAYNVQDVPQPFWIDAEGTILWSGPEDGPEIWSYLGGQEAQANPPLDVEVYFIPYIGDIDGSVDASWFAFYNKLRQWHDENSIPVALSFYPGTMNSAGFNQIIADMYTSENIELVLKGEDRYAGQRLDLMTYSQVKAALQAWQNKFVYQLEQLGYRDIKLPVTYNQLLQRFTETIRDAAHDVGFQMYLEQGTSEYGYVDGLPDFDITQYSVPLTRSGKPGPDQVFKEPNEVIGELLEFEGERMLYIDGIKVVPLLCHQQDFRISEESSALDTHKWNIYTSLLAMANADPRIQLLLPKEVYDLRRRTLHNPTKILTDFEGDDHGWIAGGAGQGRFEIGIPQPFEPNEGDCDPDSECFGTGPLEDHSAEGVNAACTNLDGYMVPDESQYTNSLESPIYDFSRCTNVNLELWSFMEIEGEGYDFCYYQYKDAPTGEWKTFAKFGSHEVDSNDWSKYTRNLSSVADGKSYFQLRFYCTTDRYFEGSGLCLDDILISLSCAGDYNGDNTVNFLDYAELAAAWLSNPISPDYNDICDQDGNDIVNIADFAILADTWLSDGYSIVPRPRLQIEICDWQGDEAGAASVSIDDSYRSCRDILNENGFDGTYYLSWTDTFSQREWGMWKSIYAEGHEIGGHTTTHESCYILDESALRWELSSNRNDILMNLGIPQEELTSFAWPNGDASDECRAIASEYYLSARGYHTNELEDKNPIDFMYLKSLNTPHYHIDPNYDPPDYFDKADEAEANGLWVNFVFHNDCNDDGAISYLAEKRLWVAPVGKVAKYIKERQNSRITDIVRTDSEISCVLQSSLDPRLYNQELTIKVWVSPADVNTVLVNGIETSWKNSDDHILFNVKPSGSDDIRVILQ